MTGTLGIAGAADTILGLERPRGSQSAEEAILRVTGRDVEEGDFALRWDMLTCAWKVMGDAVQYRMSKEMAEGVAIINRDGGTRTPVQWAPILDKKRAAGYLCIRQPDGSYRGKHRIVWEAHHGPLPPGRGWHVHHKNHDRLDNRIENLELLTINEHMRHHNPKRHNLPRKPPTA